MKIPGKNRNYLVLFIKSYKLYQLYTSYLIKIFGVII